MVEVRKRPFLLHLFSAKSPAPPFRFGCCYMAPKRLTSWVFHSDTAGPPWLPTPAACHPSSSLLLPSVEVLTQQGGPLPLLVVVMRVQWGVM